MSIPNIVHEMRSRQHHVLHDSSNTIFNHPPSPPSPRSCWSELPQELLKEVLSRVEATESRWPSRRNVVACAGVCVSWRLLTKEIVPVLESSAKLTFPISLKQAGPEGSLVQCFIRRDRSTQTYYLYLGLTNALSDDGKFLLAARKLKRTTCTEYIISFHPNDISRASNTYVGKLRSNFLGTKFTVFDGQPPHSGAKMRKGRSSKLVKKQVSPKVPFGSYPVAQITYELNALGSRGPRRMQCILGFVPASAAESEGVDPSQTEFQSRYADPSSSSFLSAQSKQASTNKVLPGSLSRTNESAFMLKNKTPRWHEHLRCWCLNFHGRVTVASVKNFQLVASIENRRDGPQHEKVVLQFGKVGKDLFTMDYGYPISAFQAFATSLSSFETRIACE